MPMPTMPTPETMPRDARHAIARHVAHARTLTLRMVDPARTLGERQTARVARARVMADAQAIAAEHGALDA